MSEPDPDQEDWVDEFKKLNAASKPASAPPPGDAPAARPDPSPAKDTSSRSERRRQARFETDETSAQLYKEGLLTFIGVGKSNLARAAVNLSEGGVQLLVRERLAPGTKVRLRIAVEKFNDTIDAPGLVRWCFQSSKKKGDFYVGVQLTETTSTQNRKITAMREWFTSLEYRAMKQKRMRAGEKPPGIIFPK